MTLTNMTINHLSRIFIMFIVLIVGLIAFALIINILAARVASADAPLKPGNGHAGEHGRHKGRPFISPSCPDGGTCP